MIAVFGLGDEHARHKSPQRQRQPAQFGEPRHAEGEQQHVEHEQFGGFLLGDQVEPRAQQLLSKDEQCRQHDSRLEHGDGDGAAEVAVTLSECRNDDDEWHHGKVLEQQHAHDLLSVGRIQLGTLDQQLADDGGRGHRQDAAQCQPRTPVHRKSQTCQHHQSDGHNHLCRTQPEHQPLHGA